MNQLGDHAIVIGGSIAGLMAARVLSDYFAQVTILERDQIEDGTVVRKSVPQANHLHGLLQSGQRVLAGLYPEFIEQLRALGAARLTMGRDVVWRVPDGKAYTPSGSLRQPRDFGFEGYLASRGLIELLIRQRTLALPNVNFESGAAVRELAHRNRCVTGVCREGPGVIQGDLVVDATGRGSRAPRWLETMGFARPAETTIGVDAAYSSAFYRRPKDYDDEPLVFVTGPPPAFTRRGYAAAIEDEILLVGVVGAFGDYPPTDEGASQVRRAVALFFYCGADEQVRSPDADRPSPVPIQRAAALRTDVVLSRRPFDRWRRLVLFQPGPCTRDEYRGAACEGIARGFSQLHASVARTRWARFIILFQSSGTELHAMDAGGRV
jgi:glycine/D-amino acid oxidase-like deaminating enzyme